MRFVLKSHLLARACMASVTLICAGASTAWAQTASGGNQGLEVVTVTAERTTTNAQTTPMAVSAVSGDSLQQRDINTLQDLSTNIPGFTFGANFGQAHPSVRGIGDSDIEPGGDPRVAFYLDDVYVARPEEQLGAFFDVDQVQVLFGPQGSLYGRNATGGAILVTTRKPTDTTSGYLDTTLGNYDTFNTEGALSGSITDVLSGRIAFQTINHGGYGQNIITGNGVNDSNQQSLRLSFLWKPTENFNVFFEGDYHHENDHDYAQYYDGEANFAGAIPLGLALGGIIPPKNSWNVANEQDPINRRNLWGSTITASWQLGAVTLKSITGYRGDDIFATTDLDTSSLPLATVYVLESDNQVSEEIQAIGEMGRHHWIVGATYFNEVFSGGEPVSINLLDLGAPVSFVTQGVDQQGKLRTTSIAGYAKYTYDVTDQLSATIGGRYSFERKYVHDVFEADFSRPFSLSNPIIPVPPFPRTAAKDYYALTPSVTVNYSFTPDIFAYASATKGYKSGGWNIGVDQPAFNPEKIWDYEAGLKTTLLDGRLQTDVSGFYYNYSDLQVAIVQGTQVLIQNAAQARLYGGEASVKFIPVTDLQLDLGLSAEHSEFTNYTSADPANPQLGTQNLVGNQLPQAPNFTVNLGAQYTWHLELGNVTARGEYHWVDTIYFTPFETPNAWQSGNSRANLYLTFLDNSGHWNLTAFVRNLTDYRAVAQAFNTTALIGYPVEATLQPPRTYGIKIGYSF